MSEQNNLQLWDAHRTPHKDALKAFNRRGFQGTAIDPMWLIREATREWGPMGARWGYTVTRESIVRDLPDGVVVHVCNIELFYPGPNGEVAKLPQVGQTWLVEKTSSGPRVDEEAPKKSRTDAVCKALSWLGFGADVHMGMFDGNKYVDLRADGAAPAPAPTPPPPKAPPKPKDDGKFMASINDLVFRGITALSGKGVDAHMTMEERMLRILGNHGFEKVEELTDRKDQVAFYNALKETVEAIEEQAA